MPLNLTDADRAAIAAAWVGAAFGNGGARAIQACAEATYLAGLRAGIERAAKVCENVANDLDSDGFDACMDCYRAIRALLDE
jgi:hypothetical protein